MVSQHSRAEPFIGVLVPEGEGRCRKNRAVYPPDAARTTLARWLRGLRGLDGCVRGGQAEPGRAARAWATAAATR